MKKFYFFLLALMVGFVANAATVYFENANNWATVAAYVYSPEVAKWPGTVVSSTTIDGHTLYSYTTTSKFIIFNNNNNGSQTMDLPVVDGVVYNGKTNLKGTNNQDPVAKIVNGKYVSGEVEIEKEVYLIGGMNNWTEADPTYKFTKANDNEFTFHLAELAKTVEFKIYMNGYWESTEGMSIESGKTYSCGTGNPSNMTLAANGTDVNFTYNISTNKLTVTYTTDGGNTPVDPDPVEDYAGWYLNVIGVGGNLAEGVAFNADGTAEVNNVPVGTGTFEIKIWNGTADAYYSNGGEVAVGEWVKLPTSSAVQMTIAGATADAKYDIAWNQATTSVKVVLVGGSVEPDPIVPSTEWYQIHGEIFGDPNWSDLDLADEDGDGIFEAVANITTAGEFGMRKYASNADTNPVWIGGDVQVTEANTPYTMVEGGNSSTTLTGKYTIKYNSKNQQITFVPFEGEIEDVITWALRGNIVTGEWADYAMTEEDGKMVVVLTVDSDIENPAFGIKRMINGVQATEDGWFAAPSAAQATIAEAGTYQGGSVGVTNWVPSLFGMYTFSFEPETMILTVTSGNTGIANIAADENAPVEYYNLQGVRVANPENGLYIRRQGNTVTKVLVK